jgi:hypothetical protein
VKTRFTDDEIDYTGKQLRSHWIMERFGISGDAVVCFVGSCGVSGEDLVDREDFLLGKTVEGDRMLHFIGEVFGVGLVGITFAQRLLCTIVEKVLNSAAGKQLVERRGDDLYVGEGKLSVSVATVSPVSGLVHLGLNITKAGVPVSAASLSELGVDYRRVAQAVLSGFAAEIDSCLEASRKVRPVI